MSDVLQVINDEAVNSYDAGRGQAFEEFIYTSFTNYNRLNQNNTFISFLPKIPPHYNSTKSPDVQYYHGTVPIEQVDVVYRLYYYEASSGVVYLLEERVLHTIEIEGVNLLENTPAEN